jgi:ABC-type transport system substrate-binding protein
MSDGTPLVADDVVYTVETAMEFSPNNDTGSYFVSAVADDEHTVTI